MGCISSELCYLQGVTELKVIWHPTQRPPLTALFWGWLALQESLERDSLVLETSIS